jgi:hypothetical protein
MSGSVVRGLWSVGRPSGKNLRQFFVQQTHCSVHVIRNGPQTTDHGPSTTKTLQSAKMSPFFFIARLTKRALESLLSKGLMENRVHRVEKGILVEWFLDQAYATVG